MRSNHRPVRSAASIAFVAGIAALGLAGLTPADAADKESRAKAERGKYLVATAGCMDCHTPFKMGPKGPEPDMSHMLSGHPENLNMPPVPTLPPGPWLVVSSATNTAIAGPWGVSFGANLTPDDDTGLGLWTERDFMQTIRTGRLQGKGREVLPPMPIAVYNNFSDRDLSAIFTYLRTIPPIRNRVPEPWAPGAPAPGPAAAAK